MLAISADGRLAGPSLKAYDLTASKEAANLNVGSSATILELSPDGRYALTSRITEAIMWGLRSVGQ